MVINKNYPYYEQEKLNNLQELIELWMKKTPDNIAFSYREKGVIISKTFNDVYLDVTYLSNYFNHYYKNKHIALIGENSYNWIIMFLGIILSGNVCVVIDKDSDLDKVNYLMKSSDTKIIYYSDKYCSFIKDTKYKKDLINDIDNYIEEGKKYKNKNKIKSDEVATIFFTSGTTGPNKGVMLSQKNITSDIYGATSLFKLGGSTVSVLPYHHAFGLITAILKPFYYGQNTFINASLKDIMNDLKLVKPETLFVVPLFVETFYKQIWKTARKTKSDKKLKMGLKLSNSLLKVKIDLRKTLFKKAIVDEFGGNLKYIICGGAYLNPKYVKWFRSIGIEILNGYGITECSPVVSVNRNHYGRDGSVGQICRDVDVKIIDGEVCIKGDNIMLGYYKDKKATKETIIDNYFHTGDLGYVDKDGFLFITGRKKNIIILSNGENISPEVIEGELLNDKAVSEVVVYEKNNKIIAQIYPNEEYLGDEEYFDNLIYHYNKNKPKNHQIAMVELREVEFVKNSSKKILRNKIDERN